MKAQKKALFLFVGNLVARLSCEMEDDYPYQELSEPPLATITKEICQELHDLKHTLPIMTLILSVVLNPVLWD